MASAAKDENPQPLGSKVFSDLSDPNLSDKERAAAEAEAEAAAEKEENQEIEAQDARARFLGIAPLVGVDPAPESIHQNEPDVQPSPAGLSKDHREAALKSADKKAPKAKVAAKKAAPKKAAVKPAGTGKVDETMPGAPDASLVGVGPNA